MATASGVQCMGAANVLKMYDYKQVEVWAIFHNKQLIHSGADGDELDAFLQMLDGNSPSLYTLKVYRAVDDPEKITDKTECNGSFNFRLTAPGSREVSMNGVQRSTPNVMDAVTAKIAGVISDEVADIIDEKFNGKENAEPKESWGDVILGLVKEPHKLHQLIATGKMLLNGGAPPAALSGVDTQAAPPMPIRRAGGNANVVAGVVDTPDTNPAKLRLVNAINRLEKVDSDIISTMERLADLAETNKAMYDYAKTMLPPVK